MTIIQSKTLEKTLMILEHDVEEKIIVIDNGTFINASVNYFLNSEDTKYLRKRETRKIAKGIYFLLPKGEYQWLVAQH